MAKRDWSWWYATAPHRPMSTSQYAKFVGCRRRWAFRYLERIQEEQDYAAGKGDANHAELEMWSKLGILPKDDAACKAMKFAPPPRVAEAECPVRVDTDHASWIGFIDLVYDWQFESPDLLMEGGIWMSELFAARSGKPAPLGSTGITVIHDWKFTSKLDNAMDSAELKEDLAANMYALAAFEGGAQRVLCRWVYTQFDAKRNPLEVWCEIKREDAQRMLREADADCGEAERLVVLHKKGEVRALDIEPDIDYCWEYNRECPYTERCDPPKQKAWRMPAKESAVTADFKSSIASTFPASGEKAPPPLPTKKGPPPIPYKMKNEIPKDLNEEPKGEVGFVNGVGAPLAANPEQAAKHQGRDVEKAEQDAAEAAAKAAAVPAKDDLDEMTREQLRALGGQMGAFDASTKKRDATLRELIRVKRAEGHDMSDEARYGHLGREVETTVEVRQVPVTVTAETYPDGQTVVQALGEEIHKALELACERRPLGAVDYGAVDYGAVYKLVEALMAADNTQLPGSVWLALAPARASIVEALRAELAKKAA